MKLLKQLLVATVVFVIGIILFAIGSHFDSVDQPPLSKLSIVLSR